MLFALLRWSAALSQPPGDAVVDGLDALLDLAEPHDGGVRWPVADPTDAPAFVDGWCNGTARHALVFGYAYEVLGSERYREAAVAAAASADATETELGTLCCGLGGVAYALLCAQRITGEQQWRRKAERAVACAARCTGSSFYVDALYKGGAGIAVLEDELRTSRQPAMPVFEPSSASRRSGSAGITRAG